MLMKKLVLTGNIDNYRQNSHSIGILSPGITTFNSGIEFRRKRAGDLY
jgi:hypothetical protein